MDEKKEKQNIPKLLLGFVERINGDHVGAYAAQAAYFNDYVLYSLSAFFNNFDTIYTIYLQCGQ